MQWWKVWHWAFKVRPLLLLLLSGQSRDSEAFLVDDITTQTWTEMSAALKIQTHTDRKSNKENRQRNNIIHTFSFSHAHTHASADRGEKYLERCTKEFIGFTSIVLVTFLGRPVCPICVGKTLLERGPGKKPVDFYLFHFFQSPQTRPSSFFSLSTDPLNLCEMN